jgi:hypothetical protein
MATAHPDTIAGLEIWLVGARSDLTAAHAALSKLGTVTYLGNLRPAERPDTGRVHVYLRVAVAVQRPDSRATRRPAGHQPDDPGALPLAG